VRDPQAPDCRKSAMGHAFIASKATCATELIKYGDAQRDHTSISQNSMGGHRVTSCARCFTQRHSMGVCMYGEYAIRALLVLSGGARSVSLVLTSWARPVASNDSRVNH